MILCLAIEGRTVGHALTGAERPHHKVVDLGSRLFASIEGDQVLYHLENIWRRGELLGGAPGLVLYSPPAAPSVLQAAVEGWLITRRAQVERLAAEPVEHLDGLTARNGAEGRALAVAGKERA